METMPRRPKKWALILLSIVLYFALLVIVSRVRRGEDLGVIPVVVLSAATLLLGEVLWNSIRRKKTAFMGTGDLTQKMFCFGGACIAFLLLVSSTIWLFDFPKVDDVPYFVTVEE